MKIVMQPKKSIRVKRKPDNALPIDQCALYMVGSPKRLASVLKLDVAELESLLASVTNYKKFDVAQSANPFTGKTRKKRSVQEPKSRLRKLHVRLLSLMRRVRYPDYVQGAVKYRSYQTNAAAHKGARQTATFDVSNFYGSTKYYLVHDFFCRVLRCPSDIAGKLATLVTCDGAVPTGSPLSPLLSYWVAKEMFDECAELAQKHNLTFTCYIDDLTFSGDRIPRSLRSSLRIILSRYGYQLAKDKTRVFRFGMPAHITGVISLSSELVVPFSRLKAARRIVDAIGGKGSSYGFTQEELKRKLAGTIGEAATIDGQRFGKWAEYARKDASDKMAESGQ